MKLRNCTIVVIFLFCYSQQSCKKNESTANPPSLKSDTLTIGWIKKTVTGEYQLNDIFFNSATTGYLSGARIYKTTDGGNTWNPISNYHFAYNIAATSDNKVFVAGRFDLLYRSFDGGTSLDSIIISEPLDIFFVDNLNGYCITPDGLYNSSNGGANWTKINTVGLPINGLYGYEASLFCFNNSVGWMTMPDGIYRSSSSMASWQKASFGGSSPFYLSSIHATSANIIYAANYSGEIYKSTDGGLNFAFLKKLEIDEINFTDIHFISDQLGYACNGRHVFKTSNGGVTWTKVVSIGEGVLGEMHFTDNTHGWVIGDNSNAAKEAFVLIFRL